MAFLNLARYKKRTMITAGAIAYGIMMFIVTRSLLTGIDNESEINLRLYETATGRIMARGYWDEREKFPLEKSFSPDLIEPVLDTFEVSYSPRINFIGSLIFYKDPFPEDGSIPGVFTAIDPVGDNQIFALKETLVKGRWPAAGEQGMVIGHWLAEDIGADIGYTVLVETQTQDGYAQVFDMEIVGIINCPNPEITRSGMFLSLSVADEYLEMGGDVTELNVNFGMSGGTVRSADDNFNLLATQVGTLGLEAVDWKTLGADFIAISQAKTAGTGLIILLILIIAGVGISNTMLMAVYERVKELGMMRAMGMKNHQVRALFIWESAGIGFLGSIYGLGLGALMNWPLVRWGIDYGFLLRDSNFGYRIQGQMYGVWDFPSMLIAFALGIALAVLVAVFSTYRILRLDIPSSLRFQ